MPKRKAYKRYMSHNAGTGLDTAHRDMAISEEEFAANWERTFGRKSDDEERSVRSRDERTEDS